MHLHSLGCRARNFLNQKLSVTDVAEVIEISVMITILHSILICKYHSCSFTSLWMRQPRLEVRVTTNFDWYKKTIIFLINPNLTV